MPAAPLLGSLVDLAPDLVEAVGDVVEAARRDPEVARELSQERAQARRLRTISRAARQYVRAKRRDEEPGVLRVYLLTLAAVLPPDVEDRARRLDEALTVVWDLG